MDHKDITCGGEILQLNQFDLNNLIYDDNGNYLNPRIAVIAKSGSGKSWVIRDIMYVLRHIPGGTIIAPTDKMTKFYNNFISASYVNHEYEEDIIPKLLARQKIILAKNEERIKKGKKPVDPRAFYYG